MTHLVNLMDIICQKSKYLYNNQGTSEPRMPLKSSPDLLDFTFYIVDAAHFIGRDSPPPHRPVKRTGTKSNMYVFLNEIEKPAAK